MKSFFVYFSLFLLFSFFILGCGVSEKKLNSAEQRIQTLLANGVPDSLLTEAKVLVSQSRTSKKLGNGITAKAQYDSAIKIIANAEASYGATTAEIKPYVESTRKLLGEKKLNFSGTILKEADSILAQIDNLIKANNWPKAKSKCIEAESLFVGLEKDQKLAKEVKNKVIGTWIGSQKITEDGANALEKKQFVFTADGKINMVEERSGLTTPNFKEDWKFESSGTYDIKGDTIFISVTREKCLKQTYYHLKESGSKKEWVKVEKPPYDSVITSGLKDRFVTFEYLKENFKKK
jgi:hypothetical protein